MKTLESVKGSDPYLNVLATNHNVRGMNAKNGKENHAENHAVIYVGRASIVLGMIYGHEVCYLGCNHKLAPYYQYMSQVERFLKGQGFCFQYGGNNPDYISFWRSYDRDTPKNSAPRYEELLEKAYAALEHLEWI